MFIFVEMEDMRMCKMIGKFGEVNGIETKDFKEMKEKLGLIGSVSGDVGGVQVFYTNEGTNYVIVDDEKPYYGEESMYKDEDFCSDANHIKAKNQNQYTVEGLYQLLGSINDKYKDYRVWFDYNSGMSAEIGVLA